MARDLVFICYSRQDQEWLDRLSPYLTFLQDQGLRVWTDREIKPGDVWRDKIEEALSRARVAVLLVSIHFLTSEFMQQEELPTLLDAAEREGVRILWVYLETFPYQRSKLDFAQIAEQQRPQGLAAPRTDLIESLRGKATAQFRTDQIMSMTRESDD